jgi:hypothetical protein
MMDWQSHNVAQDLEWYFGGAAEADLGARSAQGGFEAAMQRMELCGPAQPGEMPVHETRAQPGDPYGSDRILDAARRAHVIRVRLDGCCTRTRRVLEAQYSDRCAIDAVSVALICQHVELVRIVDKANAKRKTPLNVRACVLWLAAREDRRELLDAVVIGCKAELSAALAEFGAANVG